MKQQERARSRTWRSSERYRQLVYALLAQLNATGVEYQIEPGPRGGWYNSRLVFPGKVTNKFPIAGEADLEIFSGLGIIVTLPVELKEPRKDDIVHAPVRLFGDNAMDIIRLVNWAGLTPRWRVS